MAQPATSATVIGSTAFHFYSGRPGFLPPHSRACFSAHMAEPPMAVELSQLCERLQSLSSGSPNGVPSMVDVILAAARSNGASDIHLEPRTDRLEIRLRIDGCVTTVASVSGPLRNNVVQR